MQCLQDEKERVREKSHKHKHKLHKRKEVDYLSLWMMHMYAARIGWAFPKAIEHGCQLSSLSSCQRITLPSRHGSDSYLLPACGLGPSKLELRSATWSMNTWHGWPVVAGPLLLRCC